MTESHSGGVTGDSEAPDGQEICEVCGETFGYRGALKRHYGSDENDCYVEECRMCGRTDFPSQKGRKQHEAKSHDRPYKHETVMRRLYCERQMGIQQIARKFGVADKTINDWLKRHGIETRDWKESITSNSANYLTDRHGYETWRVDDGEKYASIRVHRLLAVSEYGVDAFEDKVVHHKNNIPWDNRPENIEIMTDSEHKRLHATKR